MKRPLGRGFESMTPELARASRKAIGQTHSQLAEQIGESAATIMRYELGKPVSDEVVAKLRDHFQGFQIQARGDRVGFYEVYGGKWEEKIAEVGLDPAGRLYLRPAAMSFGPIGENGLGVRLDPETARLAMDDPNDVSAIEQFRRIVAAVEEESGVRLVLIAETAWTAIAPPLRSEIDEAAELS